MTSASRRTSDEVVVHLPSVHEDSVSWGPEHPVPTKHEWFAAEPVKPVGVLDSPILTAVVSVGACAGIGAAIWMSQHLTVDPALRLAGLFLHLVALAIGFGAVLIADYHLILWVLGRSTLSDAVRSAERVGIPIWVGLAGLVVSGMVLSPVLSSALTQVKVVAVLILTVNGIQAMALGRKMGAVGTGTLPVGLMLRGGATATVSQICWWIAVGVGFWNGQH
ncbi:hypothetical protein [Smaragdicoccus niigatensis]|uniref:hypothetical protein n=1 Tax=Smaragdicoccus niigatensis TaxID=359359 RepID=UPI000366A357|nr:hypothetical protein [Smaragdicoccus niigatensis]